MFAIRPLGCLLATTVAILVCQPGRGADESKAGDAVKRGAEYLESQYGKGGNPNANSHKLGGDALAGIALLEAGSKAESPGLAAIIKGIRAQALAQTETYPVALCILFFDKLAEKTGDKSDEAVLQHLGVRLYAGLSSSGGWGYSTWDDVTPQELVRLSGVLTKNELVGKPADKPGEAPKKPDDGFLAPGAPRAPAAIANLKIHPENARLLVNVQQTLRARGRSSQTGDNSNTQFGLIALWVASRHGVPVNDAFALIEARFLQNQSRQDAGWNYSPILNGLTGSTPSMTCAGLLGLAVGAGGRNALVAEGKKDKPGDAPKPAGDEPFSNPKTKPVKPAIVGGKPAEAALGSLGKFLGGTRPGAGPGAGVAGLQNFVGSGNAYYLIWSVERVAMAYGLETIGGVDWYDWGCGYLLPSQAADGSWDDAHYGPIVNTSFALLFLTKSNSVRDLSNKNKVRDPGKTELRAGAGATPALFAPPPKEGKTETKPDPKTVGPGFTLPVVLAPNDEAEIETIATGLTSAADAAWQAKLDEARDGKGTRWTRGLVLGCNRSEGERKQQARDALAERLTRMTAKTLREMLADPEIELRRAASLAAGMREDKLLIPALIERITDPSDIVVRAAKASLKSISQTDFGPPAGADAEAKAKAAATWRSWFEALPK